MSIAVYDTYVFRHGLETMHFDILVPVNVTHANVLQYLSQYLDERGISANTIRSSKCSYCHVEEPTPSVLANISAKGFHILELSGCA